MTNEIANNIANISSNNVNNEMASNRAYMFVNHLTNEIV